MIEEVKPFFTPEMRQKALQWITQKAPELQCECCHTRQWLMSEELTTPVIFAGGFNIGGTAYPHLQITCTNCGNTKFFSAVVMGLLPPKKPEGEV